MATVTIRIASLVRALGAKNRAGARRRGALYHVPFGQ
jgi:hypothetical protein